MKSRLAVFLLCLCAASFAFGQALKYPPEMPGAKVEVYKTIGDVKLNLYIFEPPGHTPADKTPAIVFFFGGGWTSGSPVQFINQCKHLASRGMVAISADYRVASRHQVQALQCVQDAKSAIRFVRANAQRLGIDPKRIAAGGGSAGGHIAACTGTLAAFDEPSEDALISSIPNAMVLFNPVVILSAEGLNVPNAQTAARKEQIERFSGRMGPEPAKLSPYHNIRKGVPPTIIFHGKADTTVPYKTVELFTEAMTKAGNTCKLVGTDGAGHGFFNFGRANSTHYQATLDGMDAFLVEQGFLKPKPAVASPK